MNLVLADAINFPLVAVVGLIGLVLLMTFEVFVEALVLRGVWHQTYRELCAFAFVANCWSLAAGIPTKILNASLYARLLPEDIPGFFQAYPKAIVIGSLVYFAVTLLVESLYAFWWQARKQSGLARGRLWFGLLLANVATYAVLAPFHYWATKPSCQIREFVSNTAWTTQPMTRLLFTDGANRHLKSIRLNGSNLETLVPLSMTDYLVSSNLDMCLFRGTNGDLNLFHRDRGQAGLIWQTDERFLMNQVAFSPSGEHVAFACDTSNWVEIVTVPTGERTQLPLAQEFDYMGPSIAWSSEEKRFFVSGFRDALRRAVEIRPGADPQVTVLESTNVPPLLTCYGRTGDRGWLGGDDWGVCYASDTCGDLTAQAWSGLDSSVRIYRDDAWDQGRVTVSVRPGWLHLARFHFGDVAFLEGCVECLFESNGYIYLLDPNDRRLGTIIQGDRFILLTARYEKLL